MSCQLKMKKNYCYDVAMNLLQGIIYWPIIVRGKICRRPTDIFLQISFEFKTCRGPTDISYQSASSVKYAVALQYLLSPIRFKAETCRGPTRINLCVSAKQAGGENIPGPYSAGSPTHPLYEKAI